MHSAKPKRLEPNWLWKFSNGIMCIRALYPKHLLKKLPKAFKMVPADSFLYHGREVYHCGMGGSGHQPF